MYDYVIVTHLPVFYKINLYNELASYKNILVVFVSDSTIEKRANDFSKLGVVNFEYKTLNHGSFQNRNKVVSCFKLLKILSAIKCKRLLLGGWDLPEFWVSIMVSPKNKNYLALESSVLDSTHVGYKKVIKQLFLSKIVSVFSSGKNHVSLLSKLSYSGEIRVTRGVGLINKPEIKISNDKYRKNFLFIGRLTKVKNLRFLVDVFNGLSGVTLTIIGDGEEFESLRTMANDNIIFLGSISNDELSFEFNRNDFLILPSIQEPWGLVVEEAIYHGLPVLISNCCGSQDLIVDKVHGFIFDPFDTLTLRNLIMSIDQKLYTELHLNVSRCDLKEKDRYQLEQYIN